MLGASRGGLYFPLELWPFRRDLPIAIMLPVIKHVLSEWCQRVGFVDIAASCPSLRVIQENDRPPWDIRRHALGSPSQAIEIELSWRANLEEFVDKKYWKNE